MTTLKVNSSSFCPILNCSKTRHCDAIQLELEIDKKYENYLLPSLSLQMLVENAVKHNALSKHNPLVIEIFSTAGNKLVVNNNLVPRTQKAPSGKIGLKNIRAKYELLKQPGFQVMEEPKVLLWCCHLYGTTAQSVKRHCLPTKVFSPHNQ